MISFQPLLVFDGDDTLWTSEPLYDRARDAAAKAVEESGLDPVEWGDLQRRIDVRNVETMGLSPDRFPTSCRQAYEELRTRQGLQPDEPGARKVYKVASSVFDSKAPLIPEAEAVLKALSGKAVLILLTKGSRSVQERRVVDSGLGPYFDEVCIVEHKTRETFVEIASRFSVSSERCWSIGNSLPSDINPAVRAGWRAIWIDAHVWEHERRETEPHSDAVIVLHRLGEVLEIFRGATGAAKDCRPLEK